MTDPAAGFKADARRAKLLAETPFPRAQLADRDHFGMTPIDTAHSPEIWHLAPNAVVRATVRGESVVRAEVLEGKAGLAAWVEHAMHLTAERKRTIEQAFAEHDTLDAALAAAFPGGRGIVSHVDIADGDAIDRMYSLRETSPLRAAVLEVRLAADGTLESHRLLEGRPAWDAAARYRDAHAKAQR